MSLSIGKVFVAVVAICSSISMAATSIQSETVAKSPKPIRLNIGPGMAIMDGEVGYGVNAGFAYRVGKQMPLYIGIDAGVSRWTASAEGSFGEFTLSADASVTAIHLLPTAIYRFESSSKVTPFLGVSVGPNIAVGKLSIGDGETSISDSETNVYFHGLLRAGVDFELSDNFALSLEPKAGILDSEFVFMPQANAVINL